MIELDGQMNIFEFLPKEQTHPGIGTLYRYFTERWRMVESSQERCREWLLTHPVKGDKDFTKVYGVPESWEFRSCYGCGKETCHAECDTVKPAGFVWKKKAIGREGKTTIISWDFYCSECGAELFHNEAMKRKVHVCPKCKRRLIDGTI